jgi:hypothetical protein
MLRQHDTSSSHGTIWRWGVALLAALPCACASTVILYDGPTRPEEEVAIFHAVEPCRVLEIDDRKVPRMENRFALEPGDHWLAFRVRRRFRDTQASTNCMAYVPMQAGHVYSVRSYFTRTTLEPAATDLLFESQVNLVVELEDTTTGALIEDMVCE